MKAVVELFSKYIVCITKGVLLPPPFEQPFQLSEWKRPIMQDVLRHRDECRLICAGLDSDSPEEVTK